VTKPRDERERDVPAEADAVLVLPADDPPASASEPDDEAPAFPRLSGADHPQPTAANDNVLLEGLGVADFTPLTADDMAAAALDPNPPTLTSTEPAAVEDADSDVAPDSGAAAPLTAAEPDVSTRVHTHVAPEGWFDATLELGRSREAAGEVKQRLAWRFRASFSAYRLLLPTAPTAEARALMMNALRRYERLLRRAAGAPRDDAAPVTEALHAQLSDQQAADVDRAMSELEGTLLTLDECLPDDQFEARFRKPHVAPKQLLRYARFLAARPFGIGYRRDRFEMLALELLTTKLPSGKLLLMQRKRAAPVLQQLLRGLPRPSATAARNSQISYLREALDRLVSLGVPQRFFDSGYYLDVYGYKLAMYEHVTSPEFLYLCVAIDVEVHNRLQSWSQAPNQLGADRSLAALQDQLRAQRTAAQGVFPNYQRPLTGVARTTRASTPTKPAKRQAVHGSGGSASWLRVGIASALVLLALGANLFTSGFVRLNPTPDVLSKDRLHDLSPLLITGRLTEHGKHFDGLISRPSWVRLAPREREGAADDLARALKLHGVDHADLLAYKTRVIHIDFGSVVFVDTGH
jgi:hypothetical protein